MKKELKIFALKFPVSITHISTVCILASATLSLFQAEWTRAHMGLLPDWYSMSYYFFIPALLWILAFPLVVRAYRQFGLVGSWGNWLIHIGIAIVLGFALKFAALFIDFQLRQLPVHFHFFSTQCDSYFWARGLTIL